MNKYQSKINQRTRKYFRDSKLLAIFFMEETTYISYYSKRKFFRKFYNKSYLNMTKVRLNSIYGTSNIK